ncbi:MAG: polysaccharide export protein, partial [Arenimonas sp.]
RNEEISFEAKGITLSQAMGRVGGLLDTRANAKGVFIFRYESATALTQDELPPGSTNDLVPVIYRVNLSDPNTFFAAQNFSIKNNDILYVSNSPAADLQKFLNTVVSTVYSFKNIFDATK